MEIKRQQELVEAFHYDVRQQSENEDTATELRVSFSPIEPVDENYPKENSILAVRLDFRLVFDDYILSGAVSQINHVLNRKIETQADVTQADVDELVLPLFQIVQRLAYEVTEIALDKPGVQLNFHSSEA